MENRQKPTNQNSDTDSVIEFAGHDYTTMSPDLQRQAWIDYRALNGLVFDFAKENDYGDLKMRKITITSFAKIIGVNRDTLYQWQTLIPDFWQRVNDRRRELNPQSRLAKMHEIWYLSALKLGTEGFRDRQLWLANFDENFRMPTEKIEHDAAGSLLDVLEKARDAQRRTDQIQEGEIVDKNSTQANT